MKMEVLLVNQFQREFGSPKLGVQGKNLDVKFSIRFPNILHRSPADGD